MPAAFAVLGRLNMAHGSALRANPRTCACPRAPHPCTATVLQVSALIGLNSLTMKKRMALTLAAAYGRGEDGGEKGGSKKGGGRGGTGWAEAAGDTAALTPLTFALPEELPEWRRWLRRQPRGAGREAWMLKTGQDAGGWWVGGLAVGGWRLGGCIRLPAGRYTTAMCVECVGVEGGAGRAGAVEQYVYTARPGTARQCQACS